ncbi:MAG: 50S ribosomal protein L13 [Candidatus Omnitrophota bacterium]|jgi:large subunit ribosomal protein L13
MKTYRPTEKDFNRKTYLIDADGKTLGRLATRVASLLIGKGKTVISPDQLCGDSVVVINAEKIHVTGKKLEQKVYTHYTGYSGGLRSATLEEVLAKQPARVILKAVQRMLPKTKLGHEMFRRLRVYAGKEHRQSAQKPVRVEV